MNSELVLDMEQVSISYPVKGPVRSKRLRVVSDLDLTVARHETVALVGESGSGKSTTARAALRLLDSETGRISWAGVDVTQLSERQLRPLRSRAQMIFQDPYSSLNPAMTVFQLIAEALGQTSLPRTEWRGRVQQLLEDVGLSSGHADRYPYEFSGGQRQRVAIARALAFEPDLIICDEAVSALDVSTQNQIMALLARLREEHGIAYLFISHDLALVRHLAHRVLVMYAGRVVESGAPKDIFTSPRHPYTRALLSAVPQVSARSRQERGARIELPGDVPRPGSVTRGCVFRSRCPWAMPICAEEMPEPFITDEQTMAKCYLHTVGPKLQGGSVSSLPIPTVRDRAAGESTSVTPEPSSGTLRR